jgi:hypothetical protein
VKAHPVLREHDGETAFREVDHIIKTWRRARKEDAWEKWFGLNTDDAAIEFMDNWDLVTWLPGVSPLEQAVEKARKHPFRLQKNRGTPHYGLLVSAAGWLQAMRGDQAIFLPQVHLGELMGLKQTTVSRLIRWAEQDGHLKKVAAEVPTKLAAEYRFNLTRFRQEDRGHAFDIVETK